MNRVQLSMQQEGLVRPREGRVLAGVCAGLGRRYGISPWTVRIVFVIIMISVPFSLLPVYPVLWFLMPSE